MAAATAAVTDHKGAGSLGVDDAVVVSVENAGSSETQPAERKKAIWADCLPPLPGQAKVEKFYNHVIIQVGVAAIIGANFATNIIEKQVDPAGNNYPEVFRAFSLLYNILFTIELIINMYAHFWRAFWDSSWNIFDFVVVAIGVINMLQLPLPKAFSLLRNMRAFRVFRLFKRVKALNKIIVAIVSAVPGVVNAFLILTIVMCIYSILAVEFFKQVGKETSGVCGLTAAQQTTDFLRPGFDTKRQYCMGHEYFGTFSKSLYTFFQVLTGESWSENVARPVIWYYEETHLSFGAACFFVSFVLVSAFVLTNVVVAVLLDKMSEAEAAEEEPEAVEDTAPAESAPTPPPPAAAELTEEEKQVAKKLTSVKSNLAELAKSNIEMQRDFDATKADIRDIKEQIALVVKAVEKKYKTANL